MKTLGIISYNIHCNFTNYGSALQSWSLNQVVGQLGYKPVLMDYCPDVLRDANPLDPFKKMWDKDAESLRMCELTMPAIRENYKKFDRFYTERFNRSKGIYTAENFGDCVEREGLDGFVCGSDTIFCPDEFGIDDGYYANYPCMRARSVAYAPSFGTPHFRPDQLPILDARLRNFKAIGLRETTLIDRVRSATEDPVQRVCDPTLLLDKSDYDQIAEAPPREGPFLLLYSRRDDPRMTAFASDLAKRNGWRVEEISIRASHAGMGHEMRYDAGVEEFLGLVRAAEFVVTNSYHGMIFAIHYQRPFSVFTREQCDTKMEELASWICVPKSEARFVYESPRDWMTVFNRIKFVREESMRFLSDSLNQL